MASKVYRQKQGVAYVTHSGTFMSPELSAEKIADYRYSNINYKKAKNDQRQLLFSNPPKISVYDDTGEINENATTRLTDMCFSKPVNLWTNIQIGWGDVFDFGAALFNPVWEYKNNEYILKELRHLPPESFDTVPSADFVVQSEILQGIGVDRSGQIKYYQVDYDGAPHELTNIWMLTDPLSSRVAGEPISLPILPIIGAIKFALNSQMQKVNRLGAPVPWVRINDPQPANQQNDHVSDEDYAQMFLQNASKDVAMPLRENMEIVDPYQSESGSAMETLNFLSKLIADYWSPASLISKDGTLIGGSSASEMGLLLRYVSSIHEWLENAFEELLQPYLDANGYEGYSIDIEIPEPEVDTSTLDMKRAIAANKAPWAIKANEYRRLLGLPEDSSLEDAYLSDLKPDPMPSMNQLMNTEEKPTTRQAENMSEKKQKDIWRDVADEILEAVENEEVRT